MRTIRMTAGLVALGVVLVTQTAEMQDKPFVRVTKEQGMAALKTAADAAKGNYASLESNFQKEIRKIWNDYDNVTYKVYERVEMVVLVMGPCELMLSQASSTTKRGDSIEGIGWPGGVTVYVSALTNEAPDIVDFIVERDGKAVEPIRKSLQTRQIQTVLGGRQGTNRTVHEGGYLYAESAFDPGGKVIVTAVSDTGRKYSKEIFDRDLRKIE